MATSEPDFPEGEANASDRDRGPEGIHGGRRRNRGHGRRTRARRAHALRQLQETTGAYYTGVAAPGCLPTPNHSTAYYLNQPPQVWQPHLPQNVQLLQGASTNTPYYAGGNMNVHHQPVQGGGRQTGILSLGQNFCPNQLQQAPLNGILRTPPQPLPMAETYHQLPPVHNNLPVINAPYPNIDTYYVPGYAPYPLGYVPYAPGYVPYPPGYVLPYPGGIVQYPNVQYYTPPN